MSNLNEATEAMTAWWDDTTWLPFVEAENCNITGPGHQNKEAFALAVNAWDRSCGDMDLDESVFTEADVAHLWVIGGDDWETWSVVPHDVPGAVPVTCIWGQR